MAKSGPGDPLQVKVAWQFHSTPYLLRSEGCLCPIPHRALRAGLCPANHRLLSRLVLSLALQAALLPDCTPTACLRLISPFLLANSPCHLFAPLLQDWGFLSNCVAFLKSSPGPWLQSALFPFQALWILEHIPMSLTELSLTGWTP